MGSLFEIKPGIGFCTLLFGASMADAEKAFGKPKDIQLIDDIAEFKTTVWHYWENGFTLFFDEQNNQLFNCVEIDNADALLWGHRLFDLKEKQIIELFKNQGFIQFDTEHHDWGEKRLSFDALNIDFYFEKNKLISLNYGKLNLDSKLLILPN